MAPDAGEPPNRKLPKTHSAAALRRQRIEPVERIAGVLQVAPGLRQPFVRRADLGFEQVRHADSRAQQRAGPAAISWAAFAGPRASA